MQLHRFRAEHRTAGVPCAPEHSGTSEPTGSAGIYKDTAHDMFPEAQYNLGRNQNGPDWALLPGVTGVAALSSSQVGFNKHL